MTERVDDPTHPTAIARRLQHRVVSEGCRTSFRPVAALVQSTVAWLVVFLPSIDRGCRFVARLDYPSGTARPLCGCLQRGVPKQRRTAIEAGRRTHSLRPRWLEREKGRNPCWQRLDRVPPDFSDFRGLPYRVVRRTIFLASLGIERFRPLASAR